MLPAMPKLRWAQAMMAGVESWIALPDLPASLLLTCARGTHKESMPENILGAIFQSPNPTPPPWKTRSRVNGCRPSRSP